MDTKESNTPYIINLINSIIGVSVLAMPFCLKKCGLILGLSLLIGMSWLTYISCNMLVTSAVAKRRRTYEYLAFYTVGPTGKFAVELSMIGLMLGTCVAFYVIIGDLATAILQEQVDATPEQLRTLVIIFCALCIALPLGLMKNLSALGFIGMFSMAFYCLFVCVMLANSVSSGFFSFAWLHKVHFFRPAGVFQCLPIFSLAYACQCQLFTVYDSLEDASLTRMETIVTVSLRIVTFVYCTVAVLGYTTYIDNVDGNVLKNFSPNVVLDLIKIGFAISVVVGFPLMIFPCRQSIHTLFFSQHPVEGIATKTYIEPFMFKAITLCIVLSTMMVALFIPNVETILGLTGATMGSLICFIFPGIIFTKASPKEDSGVSKFVLGVGCVLLVLCTYSNVYSDAGTQNIPQKPLPIDSQQFDNINKPALPDIAIKPPIPSKPPQPEMKDMDLNRLNDHRHEPANPVPPKNDNDKEDDKNPVDFEKVPNQVDPPINNQAEDLIREEKINSESDGKEKAVDVKAQDEVKENNVIEPKIVDAVHGNEPAKPALRENAKLQGEKDSDNNHQAKINNEKPVEQKPVETIIHKVENPPSKRESVQNEVVENRVAAEDTKNENVKNANGLIDEKILLKQLKEQQQKQQQLLQEEGHLIKFLEKSQNAQQAEKQVVQRRDEEVRKQDEKLNNKALGLEVKNSQLVDDPNKQELQPPIEPENLAPVVDSQNNLPKTDNSQVKKSVDLKKEVDNPVAPHHIVDAPQKVAEEKKDTEQHRKSRELHDNEQVIKLFFVTNLMCMRLKLDCF